MIPAGLSQWYDVAMCHSNVLIMILSIHLALTAAAEERTLPDVSPRLVVAGQGFFPVGQLLRDGRVAVVMRGGAAHVGIKGRLDIVFSEDAGRTWSKPTVVNDSPVDDRNPAFGQAADGTLVVAFWRAAKDTYKDYAADRADQPVGTWVTRSADGGLTWSAATEIDVRDIGYGSPYGKILTLADGSMLMNVYGYAVRNPGVGPVLPKVDHSYLYRSTDGGRIWTRHGTIGNGFNETGLLQLQGGDLLAAMRSAGDRANVWVARTADGGRTWGKPEEVTGALAHPADLVRLLDGRVLMTCGVRAGPFGVRGLVGDAGGHFNWAERFTLVNDSTTADTGYPSSVVLTEGRVLTFYYAVGSKSHPDWGIHCGVTEYQPPAK